MTEAENRPAVGLAKETVWADRDGLKELFRGVLQEGLEAERRDAIGAAKSERTEGRRGCRSGYDPRGLIPRLGEIELRVAQDRQGRFPAAPFERDQRSDKALLAALAEMCIEAASARKAKAIAGERAGHSFSAAAIVRRS